MADIVNRLAPLAVAAVAVVLFLGLVNMMRGGPSNRSQLLMRWRVILQLIAIIVVMAALYMTQVFRNG
ncbi:MAG: twin transmembrane helix small protein [Chloroflexi bacterium]|nr:twin transmembrane helix small protein [Chloroflexota bacterium]